MILKFKATLNVRTSYNCGFTVFSKYFEILYSKF